MAPQRTRGPQDDARSEISTGKERHPALHSAGVTKGKRPAVSSLTIANTNHKEAKSAPLAETIPIPTPDAPAGHSGGINWTTLPNTSLHAYRHAHRLVVAPAAFASAHNQLVLADPAGLGRFSPTVAGRERARRRAPKEALAQAVRRDFNAAPVSEMDAITGFLYAVKNQNKQFKAHFSPANGK